MTDTVPAWQSVALAIVPKLTSSLSIPCQLWIIRQVLSDHRRKRGKATSRALLGMGCVDISASFGWFLSTWAAPSDAAGVPYAAGTVGTCTFQGFLLQLAIGAPFYNCLLSLLYLLTVRYGWKEDRLRNVEYICHAAILLFAIGTGLALIPLGMYNHIGSVCWVMGAPQGCGHSSFGSGEPGVPCDRGDCAWIYGVSLFYGPLWVCICFTTAAMALIYHKVKATEGRSRRYTVMAGAPPARNRADEVKTQALLYVLAFYISWLPSTLWSITQWRGQPMFWLDLLATICEPSQGWMNLLVFIRPRKSLQRKLKHDVLALLSLGIYRGTSIDDGDDDEEGNRSSSNTSQSRLRAAQHPSRFSLMNFRDSNGDLSMVSSRNSKSNIAADAQESDGEVDAPNIPNTIEKENANEHQTPPRRISSLMDIDEEEDETAVKNGDSVREDEWHDHA